MNWNHIYSPTLRGLIRYFSQLLNFLRNSWEHPIFFDNGMSLKIQADTYFILLQQM